MLKQLASPYVGKAATFKVSITAEPLSYHGDLFKNRDCVSLLLLKNYLYDGGVVRADSRN